MNVYDFDKTVYDGDLSIDFWIFCLSRKPVLIRFIPRQMIGFILYFMKKISKEELKSRYFSFFSGIENVDSLVNDFWNGKERKIKHWYKEIRQESDCIISASPYFLLSEICRRLGIKNLIATDVNEKTGNLQGLNCSGMNKLDFFHKQFNDVEIDFFYSDSFSDLPMAKASRRAFFVKGNKISDWIFREEV